MGIYSEQLPTAIVEELRALMGRRKALVKDVAREAGISVNTMSRYLNEKSPIPLDSFAAICEALGDDPASVIARAAESVKQQNR